MKDEDVLIMKDACCSAMCQKRHRCARHISNVEGTCWAHNYFAEGFGSMSDNGYEEAWRCGDLGFWEMFIPIETEITDNTNNIECGVVWTDLNSTVESHFSVSCIICGESVKLTQDEEWSLKYGHSIGSKVCEKCRQAVLRMREQMK